MVYIPGQSAAKTATQVQTVKTWTPEEKAANAKAAAASVAKREAEKHAGGILGVVKRTFSTNPVDTVKDLGKAVQKDTSRFAESTHVKALNDVFSLTGKNGLFTNPEGYAKSVGSGVKTDLETGARVMGEFGSGKWKDLAAEAGGDLTRAAGASKSVQDKASRFGSKAGEAYETADKYAAVAKGAYDGMESGDVRGALKAAEGAGGDIGNAARVGGAGYDALESTKKSIEGMGVSASGFIGAAPGMISGTGLAGMGASNAMSLSPKTSIDLGGGLGPDTARVVVSGSKAQAVDSVTPTDPISARDSAVQVKTVGQLVSEFFSAFFGS